MFTVRKCTAYLLGMNSSYCCFIRRRTLECWFLSVCLDKTRGLILLWLSFISCFHKGLEFVQRPAKTKVEIELEVCCRLKDKL